MNLNFNLKNKNQIQIKNEILNKLTKVREIYNTDFNYHDLFFNVVQNSSSKNNLKLTINKYGNYTLKHIGGNGSESTGNLDSKKEKQTLGPKGNLFNARTN